MARICCMCPHTGLSWARSFYWDLGLRPAPRRRVRKILRNNDPMQPAHSQKMRISHARGEERMVIRTADLDI